MLAVIFHTFRAVLLLVAGVTFADNELRLSNAPADPLMTKEAIATRQAPEELVFQGLLAGEPAFLLVDHCTVYRVERAEKGGAQWTEVLSPEFYPWFSVCDRESMAFKGGALTVTLGRMAIGAGGCCATGGTYRSVDGRVWKKVKDT